MKETEYNKYFLSLIPFMVLEFIKVAKTLRYLLLLNKRVVIENNTHVSLEIELRYILYLPL